MELVTNSDHILIYGDSAGNVSLDAGQAIPTWPFPFPSSGFSLGSFH